VYISTRQPILYELGLNPWCLAVVVGVIGCPIMRSLSNHLNMFSLANITLLISSLWCEMVYAGTSILTTDKQKNNVYKWEQHSLHVLFCGVALDSYLTFKSSDFYQNKGHSASAQILISNEFFVRVRDTFLVLGIQKTNLYQKNIKLLVGISVWVQVLWNQTQSLSELYHFSFSRLSSNLNFS